MQETKSIDENEENVNLIVPATRHNCQQEAQVAVNYINCAS